MFIFTLVYINRKEKLSHNACACADSRTWRSAEGYRHFHSIIQNFFWFDAAYNWCTITKWVTYMLLAVQHHRQIFQHLPFHLFPRRLLRRHNLHRSLQFWLPLKLPWTQALLKTCISNAKVRLNTQPSHYKTCIRVSHCHFDCSVVHHVPMPLAVTRGFTDTTRWSLQLQYNKVWGLFSVVSRWSR